MAENIIFKGIRTNNLQGFDLEIMKNELNLIIGPSGSGKSSLAYETIAQIGLHELSSLTDSVDKEPTFKIDSYENVIVPVPIKQVNKNSNARSTIGTYFNFSQCVINIFASSLEMPYSFFILNKSENFCPYCNGLGYTHAYDENKIINFSIPIQDNPFRCWKKDDNFYKAILSKFCDENKIDKTKTFLELNEEDKKKLLWAETEEKFQVRYKYSRGSSTTRKTNFFGVMTGKAMLRDFEMPEKFCSLKTCTVCNGEKYNIEKRKFKVCNLSIGEVFLLPFNKFSSWLSEVEKKNETASFSIKSLSEFIIKANQMYLGHLFLNRSIPSLSGGELQRLRLSKLFTTQLKNLMIILDEPLAGLSGSERKIVYENILNLKEKNTLLIIDHHAIFYKSAKNIIALGEGSGINGGNLIDSKNYIESLEILDEVQKIPLGENITVQIKKNIYSYSGCKISLGKNSLNIITGASGLGKSTVLREYMPLFFENYEYINQKPLIGNKTSCVATAINIYMSVISMYAKKFNKSKSFFSHNCDNEGRCVCCNGSGFLFYGSNEFEKIAIECKECDGTGFNKNLNKFKINGKSIIDLWKMSLDELFDFFKDENKIIEKIKKARQLLLSHLILGQKTSTLSGGENTRIKLLNKVLDNTQVIGIDEPFKGLNKKEINKVSNFLVEFVKTGKTVIVVDHEEESFKYFSKVIELKNENGILVGN